jgi:hypothetical protein
VSDDHGIATLSEVLDPAVLAKHLRVISHAPWNGGAVEEVQMRVLKHYLGRRCTLEIGARTQEGWHFLIGKVYRKDRSHVFQAMEGIQQAGFGPKDEFSIPQPVAYVPSLRLLLQEKVDGPLAGEVFMSGDDENRAAAAKRCAWWLARFHATAPTAGPVSYARDLLDSESLQQCLSNIARLGGRLADKSARLYQRLEDESSSLHRVEMRPGHGGFRGTHVILAPGRTVVFDLDTYDMADPARDVARFISALRMLAITRLESIRALDATADAFLKVYLAVGSPEATKNLGFFEAASCLKRAKHSFCHPVPQWQQKAEAMLDEGLRILERKEEQHV